MVFTNNHRTMLYYRVKFRVCDWQDRLSIVCVEIVKLFRWLKKTDRNSAAESMFSNSVSNLVSALFDTVLSEFMSKAKFTALLEFEHDNEETNGPDQRQFFFFHCMKAERVHNVEYWHDDQCRSLIDKFTKCGRNRSFRWIIRINMKVSFIESPSRASSQFAVPPTLKKSQSVINVHGLSDSASCLKHALLSVLHYKDIK